MEVLIIAPHPDDEVLGCGGTIARYVEEGHRVSLCIITTTYSPDWNEEFRARRLHEINCAARILGISSVYKLDLPTVRLDTIPQAEINKKLSEVIRKTGADVIYIPWHGDINTDHRIASECSLVAARPISSNVKTIVSYETISETQWGFPAFKPNVYRDITYQINKKLDAIKCYQSELFDIPHPRSLSSIEALARVRGSDINVEYAEAFELVRHYA
jgi:LmbE family N-acetylglucosaminyl deacetylase